MSQIIVPDLPSSGRLESIINVNAMNPAAHLCREYSEGLPMGFTNILKQLHDDLNSMSVRLLMLDRIEAARRQGCRDGLSKPIKSADARKGSRRLLLVPSRIV
jgi:hypothetical protein